jgi:Papain-like cysteine protease AvrRpt2
MTTLNNYPVAQQQTANSCWACAARSIYNFMKGQTYATDQALATAYANAANNPAYANINAMRSAADALFYLGLRNNIDSAPLPIPNELENEFKKNKPVLSIVGQANPNGKPNPAYREGHWVVVIGISADKSRIDVFDPSEGRVKTVAYNAATYEPGVYWQNSSYF